MTLPGITIVVKPVQSRNAPPAILVTLPSVGIMLLLQPFINVPLSVSIKQLPAEWYFGLPFSTIILVKTVEPKNASLEILAMVLGMVMLLNSVSDNA